MGSTLDRSSLTRLYVGTARSYDFVARATSLGMDIWWKRRMLKLIPRDRTYTRILDLACGTGIVSFKLARAFPDAEIVGIDLTPEYLEVAEERKRRDRVENVEFTCMTVEEIGSLPGKFDLVTGSFIPKLVDLDALASDCRALIPPGGVVILHDFTVPTNPPLRIGYRAYWCLARAVMWLSARWRYTGHNLGRLISESRWEDELTQALVEKGFVDIHRERQPLQVASIIRAVRGPA